MPFDPELQKYAELFYEPIEGEEMPLIGDGKTYSRALGWQSPEGNFYGQERWVRDWPVAVVWDGEDYRNVEIDGEATSPGELPLPHDINPLTGEPYGPRQHFEMWAVPRLNWPPEGLKIYDGRGKEFYYWDSASQEWKYIEWYWSVDGEENLRRPGLHIGAAHVLYYYDIKVMWNGYYWTRYKHSMIEDDEPWLHVPEGFISSYNDQLTTTSGAIQTLGGDLQSLSGSVVQQFQEAAEQLDITLDEFRSRVVDARMEFTSKTTLGLYSSAVGKIGALWVNGELLLTESVTPASNTNQAVSYVGGNLILSPLLPNIEYYVYCGNSEFTEFPEALFLSLTPDINGRLGEDGVGANARIVGTVETDSSGYFIREIDMSIIGRKVEFSKTYWEYSDYQLQFVDQNTLAFNKIDGTSGLIYINGQLLDLGSGRDLDREAYRIEWNIGPDLDTSDILANTIYQIYIANDSIEYNFNGEDPTTGLPYEEGPNYFAFLDFRRQLFLSTKQHDHRLFDQEYPGYYARHIGQILTDEAGYFKYAADISLIRQPTLNPTSLDGLSECVVVDHSTSDFYIHRKKGTTGIVYVGGKAVQTYDLNVTSEAHLIHTVTVNDPLYSYDEESPSFDVNNPLVDSGLNIGEKPGILIYVYLANDVSCWDSIRKYTLTSPKFWGPVFCSLSEPHGGYLSNNWPGNQARWIATLQLSPGTLGAELVTNGSFTSDSSWTKGTGWAWSSNNQNMVHASGSASSLSQNISITSGKLYSVSCYISGRTAGTLTPKVGNTYGVAIAGNTSSTQYLLASNTSGLELISDSYFDGAVDNVIVKEVTAGILSGTYIRDSVAGVSAAIDDAVVSNNTTYSSSKIEQIRQQLLGKINLALGLNSQYTTPQALILEYVNSSTIRLRATSSDVTIIFPNLEEVTITSAGITKTVYGNTDTLYYVYLTTAGDLSILTSSPTEIYTSIQFYGETNVLVGWLSMASTNTMTGYHNVYSFWNEPARTFVFNNAGGTGRIYYYDNFWVPIPCPAAVGSTGNVTTNLQGLLIPNGVTATSSFGNVVINYACAKRTDAGYYFGWLYSQSPGGILSSGNYVLNSGYVPMGGNYYFFDEVTYSYSKIIPNTVTSGIYYTVNVYNASVSAWARMLIGGESYYQEAIAYHPIIQVDFNNAGQVYITRQGNI